MLQKWTWIEPWGCLYHIYQKIYRLNLKLSHNFLNLKRSFEQNSGSISNTGDSCIDVSTIKLSTKWLCIWSHCHYKSDDEYIVIK